MGRRVPRFSQAVEQLDGRELPEDIDEVLTMFSPGQKLATRAASGKVLNALAAKMPTSLVDPRTWPRPTTPTLRDGKCQAR